MNTPKNHAVILLEKEYEDLEFWYPLLRMRETGIEAQVTAPVSGKIYHSKHGYPVISDSTPADINPADIGLLIIPGGHAPEHMVRHPDMVQLVRNVHMSGGLIAFIFHGGLLACSADILNGRRATSTPAIRDEMEKAGTDWHDEPVVVDDRLISSRCPDDLPAFCRAIFEETGHRFTTLV